MDPGDGFWKLAAFWICLPLTIRCQMSTASVSKISSYDCSPSHVTQGWQDIAHADSGRFAKGHHQLPPQLRGNSISGHYPTLLLLPDHKLQLLWIVVL